MLIGEFTMAMERMSLLIMMILKKIMEITVRKIKFLQFMTHKMII